MFAGKTLQGRYEILDQLGGGEFRQTFLARNKTAGDRPCILRRRKSISPEPEARLVAKRLFKREAQLFHELGQHDRVPTLLDEFEDDGQFYLVQEYIDGPPLKTELESRQPPSQPAAIALLREMLDPIRHFHYTYGPHLSLHPGSFVRRRADNKLILVEFGTASHSQARDRVAPEAQVYLPKEPHKEEPGFHDDLYAIGLIVIRALVGQPPETFVDAESGAARWRPEARVSTAFADILDKMVHPYFRDRYQNVDDVLADLEALETPLRSVSKTAAPPVPTRSKTPVPPRVPKWVWIAAPVAIVAALVALLWPAWRSSSLTRQCDRLLDAEAAEEALTYCDRAVAMRPNSPQAWEIRGDALYFLERYEGAKTAYQKAIELRPNDPKAWNNLGEALYQLGNFPEALSAYDRALEIDENYLKAWNGKGRTLMRQGDFNAALDAFERAITVNPKDAKSWENKGFVLDYLDRGREARQAYSEALAIYDNRIETDSEDIEARVGKGQVLGKLGRQEDALAAYEAALEVDPNSFRATIAKSNMLFILGRYDEAIETMDRAIELRPNSYLTWHNKGSFLNDRPVSEEGENAKRADYEAAIEAYERALEINPNFYPAWQDKASALIELERYDDALTTLDTAIELQPADPKSWGTRGIALFEKGEYEAAIAALNKALEFNPSDPIAWYYRILALSERREYDRAWESCQEALDRIPDFPDLISLCDTI